MTSGYVPLGAMIASDRLAEPFLHGTNWFAHGVTFGGHPVGSAVALANLDIFDREDLNGHVRSQRGGVPVLPGAAARPADRRRRARRRLLLRHRTGQGQGDQGDVRRRRVGAPAARVPVEGALRRGPLLPGRRPRRPGRAARAAADLRRVALRRDGADPAVRAHRGVEPSDVSPDQGVRDVVPRRRGALASARGRIGRERLCDRRRLRALSFWMSTVEDDLTPRPSLAGSTSTWTSRSSGRATPGCGRRTTWPWRIRRCGSPCSRPRSPGSARRGATAAGARRCSRCRVPSLARRHGRAARRGPATRDARHGRRGRSGRGGGRDRLPLRQGRHGGAGPDAGPAGPRAVGGGGGAGIRVRI